MCDAIDKYGNPFREASDELIALHTRDIANSDVVATVQKIQQIGQNAFNTFVEERLEEGEKSLPLSIEEQCRYSVHR